MLQAFMAGRVLVGGYFIFSAFEHFVGVGKLAHHAASKGVPFPELAIIGSGLLLLVAGVSFLLGVLPKIGVAATVLFLVPVTLVMHGFWGDRDPATRMNNLVNFTKNVALLGSALMFLGVPEPWPYSVGARRRWRLRTRVPA